LLVSLNNFVILFQPLLFLHLKCLPACLSVYVIHNALIGMLQLKKSSEVNLRETALSNWCYNNDMWIREAERTTALYLTATVTTSNRRSRVICTRLLCWLELQLCGTQQTVLYHHTDIAVYEPPTTRNQSSSNKLIVAETKQ